MQAQDSQTWAVDFDRRRAPAVPLEAVAGDEGPAIETHPGPELPAPVAIKSSASSSSDAMSMASSSSLSVS